jgi:hypothetical protein
VNLGAVHTTPLSRDEKISPFIGKRVDEALAEEIGEAVAAGLVIHNNTAMTPKRPSKDGFGVHQTLLPRRGREVRGRQSRDGDARPLRLALIAGRNVLARSDFLRHCWSGEFQSAHEAPIRTRRRHCSCLVLRPFSRRPPTTRWSRRRGR